VLFFTPQAFQDVILTYSAILNFLSVSFVIESEHLWINLAILPALGLLVSFGEQIQISLCNF
jgi:hypothetical protein